MLRCAQHDRKALRHSERDVCPGMADIRGRHPLFGTGLRLCRAPPHGHRPDGRPRARSDDLSGRNSPREYGQGHLNAHLKSWNCRLRLPVACATQCSPKSLSGADLMLGACGPAGSPRGARDRLKPVPQSETGQRLSESEGRGYAGPLLTSQYSSASFSASQEASMMSVEAPTVLHVRSPWVDSMRTRTEAPVPAALSMMRTL